MRYIPSVAGRHGPLEQRTPAHHSEWSCLLLGFLPETAWGTQCVRTLQGRQRFVVRSACGLQPCSGPWGLPRRSRAEGGRMTLSPYSADCLSMNAKGNALYVASKTPWPIMGPKKLNMVLRYARCVPRPTGWGQSLIKPMNCNSSREVSIACLASDQRSRGRRGSFPT
jgi:hypothetical protein